jgi:conjugative transfer signal peptidase TraF
MCPASTPRQRFVRLALLAGRLAIVGAVGCRRIAAHLIINATSSSPRGLYWSKPRSPIARADAVLLAVPGTLRPLVTERRYLPPSVPLLKHVIALAGDRVCLSDGAYVVNGRIVSVVAARDRVGRPLPAPFPFCGNVPAGSVFVAGLGASSLDSRYFGPVAVSDLTPVVPLWTM